MKKIIVTGITMFAMMNLISYDEALKALIEMAEEPCTLSVKGDKPYKVIDGRAKAFDEAVSDAVSEIDGTVIIVADKDGNIIGEIGNI